MARLVLSDDIRGRRSGLLGHWMNPGLVARRPRSPRQMKTKKPTPDDCSLTNIDPQQWADQSRPLLLFSGRHRKNGLSKGIFDDAGMAPPWESISPFGENPEQAQLKYANSLVELTAAAAQEQPSHLRAFWIENPDRGEKLDVECVGKGTVQTCNVM